MDGFKRLFLVFFTLAVLNTNAQFYDDDGNVIEEDNEMQCDCDSQPSIMDIITQTIGVDTFGEDPLEIFRDQYSLPKGLRQPLDEYDYVIVGAGSAGSVLAARLSEDPQTTVLVLEAGKPECLLTDISLMAPMWANSDYAWQYQTEKQPGICTASENERCYWSRGKAVGGSGVTDFMMYTRGRPQDWDTIAAEGNNGWSYNDVIQYFMKAEKADLKRLQKNPPYHGKDGPINIENPSLRTGLVEAFLEAGRQLGYPTVDYNAPGGLGFGYIQTTSHNGHRVSPAKAYLHPHKRRNNLHILPSATVTKINIEPLTKRAYGVEYTKAGIKYTVKSRKEVILSAGPIGSPQLLMLSGVGPKQHLESIGIPVLKDLPVGRTLYDHVAFPGVVFRLNSTSYSMSLRKAINTKNLIQWMQFGEGYMSSASIVEAFGYIKTSQSNDGELVPDIGLISLSGSIASDSGDLFRKSWKIKDETYNEALSSLNDVGTWSVIPLLLNPKSRGYLELQDSNPFSHPRIYANYFSDPRDLATLREAVKFIIKLGESAAFKKYGAELHMAEYSQCKAEIPGSDGYWDCAIKTFLITPSDQMATCRMGPVNDPYAVVDEELRVYGIRGLRVVDISVIPRPIAARTTAPEVMIGEKAADMIKQKF